MTFKKSPLTEQQGRYQKCFLYNDTTKLDQQTCSKDYLYAGHTNDTTC